MPWTHITLNDLNHAMVECEQIGLATFRETYGFFPAKNIRVWHGARGPFEARPLIAAAFAHHNGGGTNLTPRSFENNDAHDFLERTFHFALQRLE